MLTVRQRILEFFQTHRTATAAEVSQAFDMSKANARRHLKILLEQGSIQTVEERPASGKGRPGRVFASSEIANGNNLEILASVLFAKFIEQDLLLQTRDSFQDLAEQIAKEIISTTETKDIPNSSRKSLTSRLNDLTRILNEVHYQSRWEAHRDAPHLILGHCPYFAIQDRHPQLCHLDAEIIQCLLGQPVEQKMRLAKDGSGFRYCVFTISSSQ